MTCFLSLQDRAATRHDTSNANTHTTHTTLSENTATTTTPQLNAQMPEELRAPLAPGAGLGGAGRALLHQYFPGAAALEEGGCARLCGVSTDGRALRAHFEAAVRDVSGGAW